MAALPASDAAISTAKPARIAPRIADGPARFFEIRLKAASRVRGYFTALSARWDIVFL
jgi:hypothetical protein